MSAARRIGLAGAAMLGVAAGVALGRGKKTVAKVELAMHGDWLGVIKSEHKAIRKLLKDMLATDFADGARRAVLLEKAGDAFVRLALQKETVLYPALRLTQGPKVDELIDRTNAIRTALRGLKSLAPEDVRWEKQARSLRRMVDRLASDEDKHVFPPFHEAQGEAENDKLTELVNREGLKLS